MTMPQTLDVTTPNDRDVVVTRVFDAPRSLIWECHTKPDLVRRWMLGPDGWTMPVCDIDLRVGGRYRNVWRSETDGSEFGFRGEYRELKAPVRLVHTEWFDGQEYDENNATVNTLTLDEEGGRTTLTYVMRFPTKEIREQALGTGMTDGMASSYDRLERVVVELQTAT
jgi:uncharacterized protein YndB with AHSA1/START domain